MFHLPITSSPSPLIYTPHLQPSCFGCRSHEVLVNDSIRLEPVWLSELLKVATTFRYLRHVCYDRSKYTRTQIVPGCYANYVAVSWHMAARLAWAGLFWLAFHTRKGNPPPYATVFGPTLTMYDDIIALRAAPSALHHMITRYSYSEVLFKALILLVNLLYTTIRAYAPLPQQQPRVITPNPTNQIRALKHTWELQ